MLSGKSRLQFMDMTNTVGASVAKAVNPAFSILVVADPEMELEPSLSRSLLRQIELKRSHAAKRVVKTARGCLLLLFFGLGLEWFVLWF